MNDTPANDSKHPDAFALVLRGTDVDLAQAMHQAFGPFILKVEEWTRRAADIHVTDASQTREIKLARESRLAIREIRIEIEKARKDLKESALRRGQLIDKCAGALKDRLEPIEAMLKEQEEFAARAEEARRAALRIERTKILDDLDVIPGARPADLAALDSITWDAYVDDAQAAKAGREMLARKAAEDAAAAARVEAEAAAVRKAEAERAEADRRAREEAQRVENERLRAEAAAREAEVKAEREARDAEVRKEREAAAAREQVERDARLAEQRKADEEQQRLQREAEEARANETRERLAREKLEVEARQREEAEAARVAREAASKKPTKAKYAAAVTSLRSIAAAVGEPTSRALALATLEAIGEQPPPVIGRFPGCRESS